MNKNNVMGRPSIPADERFVYVSVGLPPALRDAITDYAWDNRRRVAEVIREILEEKFSSPPEAGLDAVFPRVIIRS